MENKDYIYVYDEKGKKQKMELVAKVEIPENPYQYIVYKEPDKKTPLYIAKLELAQGITAIETNISQEEKDIVIAAIKKELVEGSNELY